MKDIISYSEILTKEGFQVQKGMNYRPNNKDYSIFLMSTSENSPYNDGFDDTGSFLLYEGHDVIKRDDIKPKELDQPFFYKNGDLTDNGTFFKAVEDLKLNRKIKPEKIQVYDKLEDGVWADLGFFNLKDATYKQSEHEQRKVFIFTLEPIALSSKSIDEEILGDLEFSRRIPSEIKKIVYERDEGKCVECGSKENLHYDHILPFSKGGTSTNPKNIQILCQKHNLEKSDKIQ